VQTRESELLSSLATYDGTRFVTHHRASSAGARSRVVRVNYALLRLRASRLDAAADANITEAASPSCWGTQTDTSR